MRFCPDPAKAIMKKYIMKFGGVRGFAISAGNTFCEDSSNLKGRIWGDGWDRKIIKYLWDKIIFYGRQVSIINSTGCYGESVPYN